MNGENGLGFRISRRTIELLPETITNVMSRFTLQGNLFRRHIFGGFIVELTPNLQLMLLFSSESGIWHLRKVKTLPN